jgi:hypothetical protein
MQATREAPPLPLRPGASFVSLRLWRTSARPIEYESIQEPISEAIRKGLPARFHPPPSGTPNTPLEVAGAPELLTYRTVVEAVTPIDFRRGERAVSDAFDACLEKLEDLVRAYRNYSHLPIHHISRERLPPFAVFITRTLENPPEWAEGLSLMILHMNNPGVTLPDLEDDELRELNTFLSAIVRNHPLVAFAERSVDADVALTLDGDYADALVQLQISAEVLLDGVLTLMLWEEGTAPEDAIGIFDESLAKRLRTHYGPRLGGDWNPQTSGPLARWRSDISYVRGRVVHAGYRPTIDEARKAAEALAAVEDFVKGRLADRRMRYPRTTLLTLGRPGLERRGVWSGQIKEFAERADDEPDWLGQYAVWREAFDKARS